MTMIGNYRIGKKLGEGGMGAVFAAEHALLGRRAAVKLLHASYSQRPEIVERFFNEARAATSIADPGIIQIFDFGHHDGNAFIVMELLDGESLEQRLARLQLLPASAALRLVRQLALSLHAAHVRGVIHRDLKPENIFIVSDNEVPGGERTKILDFGIAKLVDGDAQRMRTQTGMLMGTPLYMSPEQCRGMGSIDHRSDIYALGCVLFRLVVGRPPFDGEGSGDLIIAHVCEPAPVPSQLVATRPEVDAIVARCLAKAPDARYPTMQALAADVDAALRAITLSPDGAPSPLASRSLPSYAQPTTLSGAAAQQLSPRRRPRWPLAVAGALALAGGVVAYASLRRAPEPAEIARPIVAPAGRPDPIAPKPAATAPDPAKPVAPAEPAKPAAPEPEPAKPEPAKPIVVDTSAVEKPAKPRPRPASHLPKPAPAGSGSAAPAPRPPEDPYDDR